MTIPPKRLTPANSPMSQIPSNAAPREYGDSMPISPSPQCTIAPFFPRFDEGRFSLMIREEQGRFFGLFRNGKRTFFCAIFMDDLRTESNEQNGGSDDSRLPFSQWDDAMPGGFGDVALKARLPSAGAMVWASSTTFAGPQAERDYPPVPGSATPASLAAPAR